LLYSPKAAVALFVALAAIFVSRGCDQADTLRRSRPG